LRDIGDLAEHRRSRGTRRSSQPLSFRSVFDLHSG
jgi:hypothetical protein